LCPGVDKCVDKLEKFYNGFMVVDTSKAFL